MDLDFELQAANWQGAHELALEGLKGAPEDLTLWYARALAAAGLTTHDLDRSKEALLAAQKIAALAAGSDVRLDPAPLQSLLQALRAYWLQQLYDARRKDMARDKPDNINYGLQMISGDLAMNTYASSHSAKIANTLEAVQTLLPHLDLTPDAIRALFEASNGLYRIGFHKALNQESVQRMQAALGAMHRQVKEQNPGYVPPKTVSSSGCAVTLFLLASGASGLLTVAVLLLAAA